MNLTIFFDNNSQKIIMIRIDFSSSLYAFLHVVIISFLLLWNNNEHLFGII